MMMIADPSYESLRLTEKIGQLSESIGKPCYYIMNKATAENEQLICEHVWKPENIIARIPQNQKILEAGLKGEALTEKMDAVEHLADFLEKTKKSMKK